ncbi:MAG: hypothetical protein IIB64_09995 [Proteobacteria bacterium]|nr:hypothetical protein [Pseudomonadota bacterium]
MRMKSTLAVLVLASAFLLYTASPAVASDFCNGFKQGYETGYKQAKGTGLNPLTPLCPLQPLKGFGDPESDFEHGYTVGFKKGTQDGSRR